MANPNCPTCQTCCVDFCVGEIKPTCLCECPTQSVRIKPDANLVAGTLMGQRDDGFWDAYDPNATDGLEVPRGVLMVHTMTDSAGHVIKNVHPFNTGCGKLTEEVYICGTFRIEETVGNLGAALTHPAFGRVIIGNVGGAGLWKMLG